MGKKQKRIKKKAIEASKQIASNTESVETVPGVISRNSEPILAQKASLETVISIMNSR